MANFSKMKKNKGLGMPPSLDDTKGNLENPEVAIVKTKKKQEIKKQIGRPKSNKTAKLTTSLNPNFKRKLQVISINTGRSMGEIIEEAVDFWEKNKKNH